MTVHFTDSLRPLFAEARIDGTYFYNYQLSKSFMRLYLTPLADAAGHAASGTEGGALIFDLNKAPPQKN